MYIIKNAWKNVIRSKGRNLLIGLIIMAVTASGCIALSIKDSGDSLVETYKSSNPLEVTFNIDRMNFMGDRNRETTLTINPLTEDLVKEIGTSPLLSGYYYTLEVSVESDDIDAVETENYFTRPEGDENTSTGQRPNGGQGQGFVISGMSIGSFRVTAYSDLTYNADFISGDKKIKEGTIFDDSESLQIVISEELAIENDLSVGDKIKLYNTSDEDSVYEFEIVGIYEVENSASEEGFMNISLMNTANQMYTNMNGLKYLQDDSSSSSSINAVFYLDNADLLEEFEAYAYEKGLDSYYTASTNLDDILSSLQPIQNVSNFSVTFLIVILIVGGVVIAIINMINIRERKYEIGVLRAIGMNKLKVTIQLISEIAIVALIALFIGTGIGAVLSQPVTNKMLSSEIESQQNNQNQVQNNFGGPNGGGNTIQLVRPGMNVDYVTELSVNVDMVTILKLIGVNLVLIIVSSSMAIIYVNKYNPNTILQNRA